MFINPHAGWVTVKIGDWWDRASYLTNVPLDTLNAFINSINHWEPATIKFDAEGWEYVVVVDDYETYIIDYHLDDEGDCIDSFDAKPTLTIVDISKIDLAKELAIDIQSNFDEWINWCVDDCTDDKEKMKKYRNLLGEKLKTLKELISKNS